MRIVPGRHLCATFLCHPRLVPAPVAPVAPVDPKAQKCNKADAVCAHGAENAVMLAADYSASGRSGAELESEWRRLNTPSSHRGAWHPTQCRPTCPEVGACHARPHGTAAVAAASAAVGWLYGLRHTYEAGHEFWAVAYQQSASPAWMLWSAGPVLCVAWQLPVQLAKWRPRVLCRLTPYARYGVRAASRE